MSKPRISIGLPVFNGDTHLREALTSIISQSFRDFELIISDNCSTDNTASICKEFSSLDTRIRYFRQPENMGAPLNFWFVFEQATGQYFAWAAHDDLWSQNWLEVLYENRAHDVAVTFSATVHADRDLQSYGRIKVYNFKGSRIIRRIRYFLTQERGKGNIIYGLMQRDSIRRIGTFQFNRCPKSFGADFHFVFALLNQGKCISDQRALLTKRDTRIHARSNNRAMLALLLLAVGDVLGALLGITRLRYYCTYFTLSQGAFEKLLILLALPLKWLCGFADQVWFTLHSGAFLVIRRLQSQSLRHKRSP